MPLEFKDYNYIDRKLPNEQTKRHYLAIYKKWLQDMNHNGVNQ